MRRRSVVLTVLIVAAAAAIVFGGLGLMLKQEPEFYVETPAGEYLSAGSDQGLELVTRGQDLLNDIREQPEWGASFRADDLNAFFRDAMADDKGLAALLPEGCHSPRVTIDGDRIKLGVRYGEGFWSTVVWVELRVWLVTQDVNVLAIELCGLQAGGLPIGCQSLLDSISEAAHDSNVEVSWYRKDGNPVGLFRFFADQVTPPTQIRRLTVTDGTITVAGRTRRDPVGPVRED